MHTWRIQEHFISIKKKIIIAMIVHNMQVHFFSSYVLLTVDDMNVDT